MIDHTEIEQTVKALFNHSFEVNFTITNFSDSQKPPTSLNFFDAYLADVKNKKTLKTTSLKIWDPEI